MMSNNTSTYRYKQCLLVLLLCVVGNSAQCAKGYFAHDYTYELVNTFDFSTHSTAISHTAYVAEIGATMAEGHLLKYMLSTFRMVLPTSYDGIELKWVQVQVATAGSSGSIISVALDGIIKLNLVAVTGATITRTVMIPYELGPNVLTITKADGIVMKPGIFIRFYKREVPNCRPCAVNTYKAEEGDAACTRCAENSFSHAASTSIEDCICLAGFITRHNTSNATQDCLIAVGNYAMCAEGTYAASYNTLHVNTFDFSPMDTMQKHSEYATAIGATVSGHLLSWSLATLRLVLPTSYNGIELNEVQVEVSTAGGNGPGSLISIALDGNAKLDFYSISGSTVTRTVTIPYELGPNILTITKTDGIKLRQQMFLRFSTRMSSNCSPCPVNTYKATVSDAACTPCPENSFSTATGNIWYTDCVCDSGYFTRRNASNAYSHCTACRTGKFKPFAGGGV